MNGDQPGSALPPTIFIHPRCGRCQTTLCRRVRSDEQCSDCGAAAWIERHESAFELVHERSDGWYGVQDYENVYPGAIIELVVAGQWCQGTVVKLDDLGFYVRDMPTGLELEYRSYESDGRLWRWPAGGVEKSWSGPFSSREAAESVRYDSAPGYLVCGVCGWDGWKTKLPSHYRDHHAAEAATDVVGTQSMLRPMRRLS